MNEKAGAAVDKVSSEGGAAAPAEPQKASRPRRPAPSRWPAAAESSSISWSSSGTATRRLGRLTTMPSWVLRASTTTVCSSWGRVLLAVGHIRRNVHIVAGLGLNAALAAFLEEHEHGMPATDVDPRSRPRRDDGRPTTMAGLDLGSLPSRSCCEPVSFPEIAS